MARHSLLSAGSAGSHHRPRPGTWLKDSDDADASDQLLRKRLDTLALHWKTKTVAILEFTRGYNWRPNWHTETDQYKTDRYPPLRNKLQKCLWDGWSVEVVPFTIGVRGPYEEIAWPPAWRDLD